MGPSQCDSAGSVGKEIFMASIPGGAARAVRGGANLAPDRAAGGRTWEESLADRVAPSAR
jgi:hypothetical protein